MKDRCVVTPTQSSTRSQANTAATTSCPAVFPRSRSRSTAATHAEVVVEGIPVSTTHTITGAIIGVGAARKVSAVRWNIASNIVVAWIITLPAAALIAAVFYWLFEVIK